MDVERHADHVQHALLLGQDVGPPVRLAGVGHRRELQRRGVVADDAPHVVLVAELPGAELVAGEELLRGLVADLHVVDAGLDAGLVDGLDEAVVERVIVDQAAVADRAVEDLQLRAIGNPRGRSRQAPSGSIQQGTVPLAASRQCQRLALTSAGGVRLAEPRRRAGSRASDVATLPSQPRLARP